VIPDSDGGGYLHPSLPKLEKPKAIIVSSSHLSLLYTRHTQARYAYSPTHSEPKKANLPMVEQKPVAIPQPNETPKPTRSNRPTYKTLETVSNGHHSSLLPPTATPEIEMIIEKIS